MVRAARAAILSAFGPDRLHSAYLYGSIPRGTAVPGVSDLDALLALHAEPAAADRVVADHVSGALDARFPQINGAGIGQMRAAAAVARTPTADRSVLGMLVNDLGPWLAAEYSAVHGRKTARG